MSFALGFVALGLVVTGSYRYGKSVGGRSVQAKWNQDKSKTEGVVDGLRKALEAAQDNHRKREKELVDELQKSKADYANSITALRNDFKQRLRGVEARSEIYKRRAENGSDQCRNLADHTAKLDRAVEEGRHLVRELGETLRQRDRELEFVGRKLIDLHQQFSSIPGANE